MSIFCVARSVTRHSCGVAIAPPFATVFKGCPIINYSRIKPQRADSRARHTLKSTNISPNDRNRKCFKSPIVFLLPDFKIGPAVRVKLQGCGVICASKRHHMFKRFGQLCSKVSKRNHDQYAEYDLATTVLSHDLKLSPKFIERQCHKSMKLSHH